MILLKHEIGIVRAIPSDSGLMLCLHDLLILLDYKKAYKMLSYYNNKYKAKCYKGILFILEVDASEIIDHRCNVVDRKTINALRSLVKRRKYGWIAEEMK